jgi:hypothetical protein
VLELDDKANPEVLVDGALWPAYSKGRLLLPEGGHRVEGSPRFVAWKTLLQAPARITGFNGGIVEARTTLQGLRLKYSSALPATLGLSMAPRSVMVDGLPFGLPPVPPQGPRPGAASGAGSGLSLPAGTHVVDVITRPLASSLMRQASIGLSGIIVVISSLTVLAFVLLYVGGAARRLYAGDEADKPKPPAR